MDKLPNRLSEPIDACVSLIRRIIEENLTDNIRINDVVDFSIFDNKKELLEDFLSETKYDYRLDEKEIVLGDMKDQVKIFNDSLDSKTKDFIVSSAFLSLISELATEYISTKDVDELSTSEFNGFRIHMKELNFYNCLSILLDYQIYLLKCASSVSKGVFFNSLSQIFDFLLILGTEFLEKFWYYIESRRNEIQNGIFDKNVIGDRISILEICNKLTDGLKFKSAQGKSDSYKKDSFNDKFQYRVRIFISNILALEDNTGLNKYFQTSNRVVNEVTPTSKYKNDAELLKDLILLQKVFNEPYYYLKPLNHRATQKMVEIMRNVYHFLIEEEIKEAKKHKSVDPFLIKPEKTKDEKAYLMKKFSDKVFFPEKYWLSPFHESRKDSSYDDSRKEDLDVFHSQLNSSSFRRTYLLKIYIICNLFYELNSINKKDFLKSLGTPSNIKHITDDSPPDNLVNSFFKIKRELPKKMRDVDNQFSFLLQHISITEIFWWGWLIYNKDPDSSKPLFQDKSVTEAELQSAKEKSATVIPYKEKRYFNLYATPQLSRKMKVETGISTLSNPTPVDLDNYIHSIANFNDKLASTEIDSERKAIMEERNVVTWKYLKAKRLTDWLQFQALLNKQMLTYEDHKHSEDKIPSSDNLMEGQTGDLEDIEEPALKKAKLGT